MPNKHIKVQLVYRNYKPLHPLYKSLVVSPPEGIEYLIPKVRTGYAYKVGLKLYRALGDLPLFANAVEGISSRLFTGRYDDGASIIHYLQQIPASAPSIPFVVDSEHVISLFNFVTPTKQQTKHIRDILSHPNCKRIIALSNAAKNTFSFQFGDDQKILDKITVIYPAAPNYCKLFHGQQDNSLVGNGNTVKFLFVGNDVYRKGLHEVLHAFYLLPAEYARKVELIVVSDAPRHLLVRYNLPNVRCFKPQFANDDLIKKFFLTCDAFIMPTHSDTFGMVFLEALACGLPVITTKQFASPEIVRNGRNGLFVRSDRLVHNDIPIPTMSASRSYFTEKAEELLVHDLVKKVMYIVDNPSKLRSLSQSALLDFSPDGKFSVQTRSRKLKEVYCEAVGGL
jgi:glycosyltransferase involved in cell wall biosynthesis